MTGPTLPVNEAARQAAVDELNLSAVQTEEGLDRVTRLLARVTRCPIAAFTILDRDRQVFPSVVGLDERESQRSLAFCAHTIEQDELVVIDDVTLDPRFAGHPMVVGEPHIRFYAGIPIRGRDGLKVGTLCVLDQQPRHLEPAMREAIDDLRVLVEEKLRLARDLAYDPYTGAMTRRQFDDVSHREWRRAMRALQPVSMIVAEIDDWQDFRDRRGGAGFDRALRAVSLAIQYSIHRPFDSACRFDSTRFAILLPATDEPGMVEAAERVRLAVGALQIPYPESPHGVVTLSLGLDSLLGEELARFAVDDLVRTATEALRGAQAEGGNRWQFAPGALERWRQSQTDDT
ncbi:MAG TPA: diguanylate cyclase [Nevskiaceae bacterium]|nr:diguanylate cyclase [Nevskiaceae bacterium]